MSASPLDLLAPGAAGGTILFGARVGGIILIAPVFSSRTIPPMVKTSFLVVLAFLLAPVALSRSAGVPPLSPASLLGETLIGFAIGLGAAIFVGAAEAAGDMLAVHIGLSGAAALDPLTQHSVPVLGQFTHLFSIALLLALDAHLLMVDALAASTRYLPIGSPLELQGGLASMLTLGSTLFLFGLKFAAPVIATVTLANVALAVLSRVAPKLNVLSVAFPVQIGVGLFALAAALPLIATSFTDWPAAYDGVLTRVLGALAGVGGR